MQPFVINGHDQIVFPSNFIPELDLSVLNSLGQLDAVVRRDFEVKAPSGTDILRKVEKCAYSSRYELMRDMALNLFWTNRFSMTLLSSGPLAGLTSPAPGRMCHAEPDPVEGR